jgi:phenylpropionate dioxygenase-like ring-hydroxylating dioxygenase large terminal subunit
LVWVSPESAPPPFEEFIKDIRPLLDEFDASGFSIWRERDEDLAVNWKAILENLCEAYHIGAVHEDSVGRVDDVASLEVSESPPLCLLTVPLGAGRLLSMLDRLCVPSGLGLTQRRRERYHKLVVAPNAVINLTPLFMTVYQAWPVEPGACVLRYTFLPRRGLNPLASLRVLASYAGSRLILKEDLGVLPRFQRGQLYRSRPHVLHELERAVLFLARERAKQLDA